jgi:monofunctional biosynthetic peptidoglycan transglycosylase
VRRFRFLPIVLLLASCGQGKGCVPRFADLKTLYPHVIDHGPREPSEILLKRYPPEHWAPIEKISRKAQGAILVSEDWAFYQHRGFDEKQIRETLKESLEEGRLTRGASTITQQVVKNVYLSKERSLVRKMRELWLASKIERVVGKRRIFEVYLNIAEMGEGIYGIGQASRRYFGKPPSDLTAKEGAFLAMLLPSPKKYAISYRKRQLTPYARRIIRSILNKLVMAGYLSADEREKEWQTPLSFESSSDFTVPSGEGGDPEEGDEETGDSSDLHSS